VTISHSAVLYLYTNRPNRCDQIHDLDVHYHLRYRFQRRLGSAILRRHGRSSTTDFEANDHQDGFRCHSNYSVSRNSSSKYKRKLTPPFCTCIHRFATAFSLPYLLYAPYANLGMKVGFIFAPFCVLALVWGYLFIPECKGLK
jgi:hypothetical protein